MSLRNLKLEYTYNTDDLEKQPSLFYNSVLPYARVYKRVTGYFSSSSFAFIGKGIESLIRNQGRMQFIFNVQLTEDDYRNIRLGFDTPEMIIESRFLSDLSTLPNECIYNHAKVLGWLIATHILEIKIGYVEDEDNIDFGIEPILHQKSGIIEDDEGNVVAFNGSNNESASGLLYNTEYFTVFCSWNKGTEGYVSDIQNNFDQFWNNEGNKTRVISFPEAVEKELISIAPKSEDELVFILKKINNPESPNLLISDKDTGEYTTTSQITLRDYQISAIDEWIKNGCRGIFEMATGTGKTITAIAAYKRILDDNPKLILVVICPYAHLLSQWENSMRRFGIPVSKYLRADGTTDKWNEIIYAESLRGYAKKNIHPLVILTTNNTACSDRFRKTFELIQEICDVSWMVVSDEVHSVGASSYQKALFDEYQYRLGLSATPERYFDEDGTQVLREYFGKTVFQFSLRQAIDTIDSVTNESYLVPYRYDVRFATLSNDELVEYNNLTKKIGVLSSIIYNSKSTTEKNFETLNRLREKRKNVLKNAGDKLNVLRGLIKELSTKKDTSHLLIYCSDSDKSQMEMAKKILDDVSKEEKRLIKYKTYTSNDSTRIMKKTGISERDKILVDFDKGYLDVLIAMKCLDEGVDVPSTKSAILMCSSGNSKEYIQRRGRILRRYPGKKYATLYDIAVLPPYLNNLETNENSSASSIIESERKRMKIFAEDSCNKPDIDILIENYYQKMIRGGDN